MLSTACRGRIAPLRRTTASQSRSRLAATGHLMFALLCEPTRCVGSAFRTWASATALFREDALRAEHAAEVLRRTWFRKSSPHHFVGNDHMRAEHAAEEVTHRNES